MSKHPGFVKLFLHIIGFSLCIMPPLATTASYFPLWIERGADHAIAGGTALLIALSILPLAKHAARLLRSPASWGVWLIIFIVFSALSKIADEMTVISFAGLLGNLAGTACFKLARRRQGNE